MSQFDLKDLTTVDLRKIDVVCDDFETKLKSGESPDLTVYAERFDDTLRVIGLMDLIVLDAFYRRNDGQSNSTAHESTTQFASDSRAHEADWNCAFSWDDYVSRFPILANVVRPAEFGPHTNEALIDERFRKVRLCGAGGLGRVSIARDQQFSRDVAIKEMRGKFADQRSFRARFVREAEITGRLEHPSIVPVYSRGEHENGQPYYVMRLIQGRSLLVAIDETMTDESNLKSSKLSLAKRKLLQRLIDVCQAVEYAHNQSVIHRDIKPENIMLGDYGETLLVDWGLAKVVGQSNPDWTPENATDDADGHTRVGSVLGTPAYMSPEQSKGDNENVDQRSDIYCIGATLFHILTGSPPKQTHQRSNDTALANSTNRHFLENGSIPKPFVAICNKAMETDPANRYSTPSALASDIELVLADQSVSVYKDPMFVRIRRWIDQNRAIAGTGLAAVMFAFFGLVIFSWISGKHANELGIKNNQMGKLVKQEIRMRTEAEQSEKRTSNAMAYLVNAFRSPDPNRSGREIRIVDILNQAVVQLDHDFANDPLMHAQILSAIGRTYTGLGEFTKAKQLVEQSYSIYRNQNGVEHRSTLKVGDLLAMIYDRLDDPKALELLSDILKTSKAVHGENHPETLAIRQTSASLDVSSGKAGKAILEYETLLPEFERLYGSTSRKYMTLLNGLAHAYYSDGRVSDAVNISKLVYEFRSKENGPNSLKTITGGSNYAAYIMESPNHDLAGPILVKLLSSARANLGNDHYQTLILMDHLGSFYVNNNDLELAFPLLRESLDRSKNIYGDKHSRTLVAANSLGKAYIDAGEYTKAADQFASVYEAFVQFRGPSHPETLTLANNLAIAYLTSGHYQKSIDLFKQTLATQTEVQGADHPNTIRSMINLAGTMQLASQHAESIPISRKAFQLASKRFGEDNSQAQTAQSFEAMAHLKLLDYDQARIVLQSSLDSRTRTIPDHWLRYNTMSLLGDAYFGLKQLDKAEPLLIEGYEKMMEQKQKIPVRVRIRLEQARQRLVKFYEAQDMPDKADAYREPKCNY